MRDLQIKAEPVSGEYYVPYWVRFRGSGENVHIAILDAVRRKREGAKVRHMIEHWLQSSPFPSRLCGGLRPVPATLLKHFGNYQLQAFRRYPTRDSPLVAAKSFQG